MNGDLHRGLSSVLQGALVMHKLTRSLFSLDTSEETRYNPHQSKLTKQVACSKEPIPAVLGSKENFLNLSTASLTDARFSQRDLRG